MAVAQQKLELQEKLARYEALARQFSDGPTYDSIRKEIEASQRKLREIDNRHLR